MELSVREWLPLDIPSIVGYFVEADATFLAGMGADKAKLPAREKWETLLHSEYEKPFPEKNFYYVIWLRDGQPVGHCNVDKIQFGDTATMHLHLWKQDSRQRGMGIRFVRMTLPFFFSRFELQALACEPYAHNPAPNRTLQKLGFSFVRAEYKTPGWINFPQTINRYELNRAEFDHLYPSF